MVYCVFVCFTCLFDVLCAVWLMLHMDMSEETSYSYAKKVTQIYMQNSHIYIT